MFHRPPKFDWLATVPISRRLHFEPDALIISGCDPEKRVVHLVLEGTVRLSLLTADGREQALVYLPEGSLFGEQAALGRTTIASDLVAIADEPCEIGEILTADMLAALQSRSDPLRDIMRLTSEKTSFFLQAAARSAFGSAKARVASLLAALGGDRRHVAISQERLARLCGTSRVTVAAQLHQLERDGAIGVGRSKIVIHDTSKLMAAQDQA